MPRMPSNARSPSGPAEREAASRAAFEPYFANCRGYLVREVAAFRPTVLLTFGEPAHELFTTLLDEPHAVPPEMKHAFTGAFYRGFHQRVRL